MEFEGAVSWLEGQTRGDRPRGPERARGLLSALGLSEPATRYVHVVGTNGKGSVTAYLEAGFAAAGLGGAFRSPHLVSLTERVRCRGMEISPDEVVTFVERVRRLPLPDPPAFFDLMLAMAVCCFEARRVGWAALEAGVGGASDATMAVDGVEVVVLTNVANDHLQTFGGFLALLRDKVGAARPGKPLVTAVDEEQFPLVAELAEERGARLYRYDPESPLFSLPRPPALAGSWQRVNASLAVAALRLLGFGEEAVVSALSRARLPARLERRRLDGVDLILDAAHNPHAVRALVAELPSYHLLFGANPRKDVRMMLELLSTRALSLTLTWPLPGALSGFEAPYFTDVSEALARALELAKRKKEPLLITGSFYLIGRLLRLGLL